MARYFKKKFLSYGQVIQSAHNDVLADDLAANGRCRGRLEGHHGVMVRLLVAVAVAVLALAALGPKWIPSQPASGRRRTCLATRAAVDSPISIFARV